MHTQPSIILYYDMYMYMYYLSFRLILLMREMFNFCVMYFMHVCFVSTTRSLQLS